MITKFCNNPNVKFNLIMSINFSIRLIYFYFPKMTICRYFDIADMQYSTSLYCSIYLCPVTVRIDIC